MKLFFLALSALCGVTLAADRPNVVLFLVDDMGWMDSGAYGSQYYETPNIDRFAQRAMRFTQAYASPLCSPTRASILTGKYPPRHGILTASGHQPPQPADFDFSPTTGAPSRPLISPISKNYLDPSETTLAEALRSAGYRTAHIGKWHLGLTTPHRPEAQGFDVAFHCAPDPGPPGGYFSPYGVVPEGTPTNKLKVGTITDGPPGEYIVDRQGIEAAKFIRESKDRPFFLNLWCYGVHGPWGHKPEYTAEFAQKTDPRGFQKNPIMASMLRSVDECFGRILNELDQQGLTDNTLIIFYSDNGGNVHSNIPGSAKTAKAEQVKDSPLADWRKWAGPNPPTNNSPLREGKSSLYEGGTRVPMMWSWAGHIPPGSTSDAIVGHIDLYPTVLDLLHLPKPDSQLMDGISLAPVLLGKESLPRTAFFNYFPYRPNEGGVTVVSGDFKLFRWFDPAVPRELYNLREDLSETQNLADAMPDKVKELDALIDGFMQDTGALIPKPNTAYTAQVADTTTKDPLFGIVQRSCKATLIGGALRIEATGRAPFLGTAAVRLSGPLTLKLRARTPKGGPGQVHWRSSDQPDFPKDQTADFTLPPSDDWQDVTVALPIAGPSGTLRLYLPADQAPVELQSIEFTSQSGQTKRWDFQTR
jgi:arylsulfatase A-like enzyme